jgi:hypothetical protein
VRRQVCVTHTHTLMEEWRTHTHTQEQKMLEKREKGRRGAPGPAKPSGGMYVCVSERERESARARV